MSIFGLLAATGTVQTPSQEATIEQIRQAVEGSPPGVLRWIFVLSIIGLVGILWLVHRQHRLARNQVKIAALLEDLAKRCGE